MFVTGIIIILLLIAILFVLIDINSKLPGRDYVKEALERDRKARDKAAFENR